MQRGIQDWILHEKKNFRGKASSIQITSVKSLIVIYQSYFPGLGSCIMVM